MKAEPIDDGIRVTIETATVFKVAQDVVRLGASARPETPELARNVIQIAEGALENARRLLARPVVPN